MQKIPAMQLNTPEPNPASGSPELCAFDEGLSTAEPLVPPSECIFYLEMSV
jgi:hypothetical protein